MNDLPLSDEVVRPKDEMLRDVIEDVADHRYTTEEAVAHYKGALGYRMIVDLDVFGGEGGGVIAGAPRTLR